MSECHGLYSRVKGSNKVATECTVCHMVCTMHAASDGLLSDNNPSSCAHDCICKSMRYSQAFWECAARSLGTESVFDSILNRF